MLLLLLLLVLQQPLGLPKTAKVGELQATADGVQLRADGRVVSAAQSESTPSHLRTSRCTRATFADAGAGGSG